MSGSAANITGDLAAGPLSPPEDSHEHHIKLACLPYHYHYPELGQVIDDTKF